MRTGLVSSLQGFDPAAANRRDPFVVRLWIFVLIGLSLIGAATFYYFNWQQTRYRERSEEATRQLARTVRTEVADQLAGIDRMLEAVGSAASGTLSAAPGDSRLAAAMADQARLVAPGLREIYIVDGDGRPSDLRRGDSQANTDASLATPGVLKWLSERPAESRYLAPPGMGAASGAPVMVLAQRVPAAQGKRTRVVVAVLDSAMLLHVFADLHADPVAPVMVLHREGMGVAASLPALPDAVAKPSGMSGLPPDRLAVAEGTAFWFSAEGAGRQLIAVEPLPQWPLIAVASMAEATVSEQLWKDQQGYLGIMVSLALLMLVLAVGLFEAHRRSRDASQLSHMVFEGAPTGLAVFSPDGRCLAYNQALIKLFPGDAVNPAGQHYTALPDWANAGVVKIVEACRNDGQMRSDLVCHHLAEGKERWVRYSASLVRGRGLDVVLVTALDMSEPVRARNALVESERRYREFYESSQDGIVRTDASGRFIDANQAYLEMMGYTLGELQRLRVRDVTDPEDLVVERRLVKTQADVRGYADEYEKSQRRKDGTLVELRIRLWRVRDDAGRNAGYWSVVRDVTAEKQRHAQQHLAALVFDSSDEAILLTDGEARILTVNRAFERITGYGESEVVGLRPNVLSSGIQDETFYQSMWSHLSSDGHWEGEIWDRRKNGEVYLKWLRINSIRDAGTTRVSHYVGVFSDITERRRAEEQIQYLAHHDALTGLPNRYSLRAQLEQMLGRARRDGGGLALMFIDLDNFKTINDSLGHHFGDQLLVRVAARLRDAIREGDVVARLGGDEFVVAMPGAADQEDAIGVASKIIETLRQVYEINEHALHSSPSIGIGLFPNDGDDIDTLMRNADSAMYHAKSQGRNNFQFYAPHMNAAVAQRLALERALRKSLDSDQLMLHYQPQVDLRSGRLIGAEALVRWEDPVRGMIAPTEFIAVAEQSGLIVRLGAWVMRRACQQLRQWQDRGIPVPAISINVSPLQFRHPDFVPMVRQVLEETGVDVECVDLEITESVLMESSDRSVGVLQDLRDLGVTFSIDDFGTGYSSLSYIKSFPAQRLKIDRSFVANLEHKANDSVIATAIIALAHSLGMQVVAEGAETAIQVDFLRDHDCDFAQGYYFSRPLPPKEFELWVAGL